MDLHARPPAGIPARRSSSSAAADGRPSRPFRPPRRRLARTVLFLLMAAPAGLSGQGPVRAWDVPSTVWKAVLANPFPGWPPGAGGIAASPAVPPPGVGFHGGADPGAPAGTIAAVQLAPPMISPTRALLYSGLLPGWGQRRLDKVRWWGFMAVEVVGWGFLLERQRTGHDFRTRYRDLAWFVARRGTTGERMDGDFEYYESLGKYRASGAFDANPYIGGIQPETDTTTYNGALWSLANEIFLVPGEQGTPGPGSSEYEQAMEYYATRSIGPDFQWDWNGDDVSRAEYDRLIRRSDAALRRVTTLVGVILANHLAAAFDAFITARLRAADSSAEIRLFAVPEPRGRWWVGGQLVP